MQTSQLIDLIYDRKRTLDEVAAEIEAQLPAEAITPDLLCELRIALREESEQALVVRGMLVGARMAPQGTASALDLYGMWANRANLSQIDLNLLRVAAWAYRWAGDELGRAVALVNLADGLFVRDDFAEAMEAAQAALRLFAAKQHQAGIEKAKLVQAGILIEQQRFAPADRLFAELQATIDANSSEPDDMLRYVEHLNARGFACENLNDDFARAHSFYNQATRLLPRTGINGPFPTIAFRLAFNQGILALRLGRHADARQYFEEAERWLATGLTIKQLTLADQYDLRQVQLLLALLLDDRPLALIFLDELEALVRLGIGSPKQRAELLRFKALLSEQFDQVEQLMGKAIATFRKLGADLLALACCTQLAERAYEAGRNDVAAWALSEAQTLLAAHPTPRRQLELRRIMAQHDRAMPLGERVATAHELAQAGDPLGAAALWEVVGRAYEQTAALDAAREAYGQALAAIAQARGMVRLSLHTLRLNAARRRAAERSFCLAPDAEAAFDLGEQIRAQALLDELSNAGLWRLLDHEDLQEIKQAYEQLSYAQASLSLRELRGQRPIIEGSSSASITTVQAREQAEAAYFAALQRISDAKAARVGWITGQPATRGAVQAALPPGALFVAPMLIGSEAQAELWATVLDAQGHIQRLCLADKSAWKGFTRRWQETNLLTPKGLARKEAADLALTSLYRIFFAPLEDTLTTASSLVIVLDEAMPLYPLHAAFDREHYLLERMPVSYVPSGSLLTLLRQRHGTRQSATQRWVLGYDAHAEAEYAQLKGLAAELASLSQIIGGAYRHGPFSPDELLSLSQSARSLHLMAHGQFPAQGSGRFAQLITGPRRLYADDLYRTELQADLLFLDACHSGQVGPGMQGFIGAALVSGASAVIAAMWQVQYDTARPLIRSFYQHWRSGLPCASALCRAQSDLAHTVPAGAWAHFYLTGMPELPFS